MSRREIPTIPSMRPEPDRDRWGRYMIQGRTYTRATTTAGALDDLYPLMKWKARKVIEGVATNPVLLRDVPRIAAIVDQAADWREAKEAKAALDDLCEAAAREAGGEDGSNLGTLLHTITEYADAGRFPEIAHLVPEELLDDVTAYLVTMRDAGIECPPEYIERILVNEEVDSAGTTDRILVMPTPCRKCGAFLRIGDLKTQKSVDFGWLKIAIQLSEYAYANGIVDPETNLVGPMPDDLCRCFGVVMHLPVGSGKCDLYEIDLVAGWEAAQLAHRVRLTRGKSKQMGWPLRLPSLTGERIRDVARLGSEHGPELANIPAGSVVAPRIALPHPGRGGYTPGTVLPPAGCCCTIDTRDGRILDREDSCPAHGAGAVVAPPDSQIRYLIAQAPHVESLWALWREFEPLGLWTNDMTEAAAARRAQLEAAS
jgi:hypothetical protein